MFNNIFQKVTKLFNVLASIVALIFVNMVSIAFKIGKLEYNPLQILMLFNVILGFGVIILIVNVVLYLKANNINSLTKVYKMITDKALRNALIRDVKLMMKTSGFSLLKEMNSRAKTMVVLTVMALGILWYYVPIVMLPIASIAIGYGVYYVAKDIRRIIFSISF